MTSQQAVGRSVNIDQAAKGKTSFINFEVKAIVCNNFRPTAPGSELKLVDALSQNTFSSFDFPAATPTDEVFNIDVNAVDVPNMSNSDAEPEPYLGTKSYVVLFFFFFFSPLSLLQNNNNNKTTKGIRFASALDGKGLNAHGRPSLSLVFCLDISGSMESSFSNDEKNSNENWFRRDNGSSKLNAAKKCIVAIGKQLRPSDDVAILLFNHSQSVLLPMTSLEKFTPKKINALFEREMKKVTTSGGTQLADGLEAAIDLARQGDSGSSYQSGTQNSTQSTCPLKLRRVMFLTDMESGQEDEDAVVELIRKSATAPDIRSSVHVTVIGIGVDLSVGTVQSLSSIAGCRYMSVASTEEFTNSIADEFAHDVTPIALNIRFELASGGAWAFEKGVGSAELNGISRGDMHFTISSEFPMPTISNDGKMKGGLLLFKLTKNTAPSTPMCKEESESEALQRSVKILSSWTTIDGKICSKSQSVEILSMNASGTIVVPSLSAPAPAPSLWNRFLSIFSTEPAPQAVEQSSDLRAGVMAIRKGVALMKYVEIQNDYCLDDMHESENTDVHLHKAWIDRIEKFKECFEEELQRLGDNSLDLEHGSNAATAQTLAQIIELESQEVKEKEEAHEKAILRAKGLDKLRGAMKLQEDLVPHSFLCPISKDIMEDAVIAADGHSYDRSQIEQWLSSNGKSPKTGALLSSKTLIPNHSLQQAIQDFAANFDKPNSRAAAVAVATANNAASESTPFKSTPLGRGNIRTNKKSAVAKVASRVTKTSKSSQRFASKKNPQLRAKNGTKSSKNSPKKPDRKRSSASTGKMQSKSKTPRLSK